MTVTLANRKQEQRNCFLFLVMEICLQFYPLKKDKLQNLYPPFSVEANLHAGTRGAAHIDSLLQIILQMAVFRVFDFWLLENIW